MHTKQIAAVEVGDVIRRGPRAHWIKVSHTFDLGLGILVEGRRDGRQITEYVRAGREVEVR